MNTDMKSKRWPMTVLLAAVTVLTLVVLAACMRPISLPGAAPSATGEAPAVVATEQVTSTEQAAATELATTEPAAAQQPMADQFVAADAPPETYKDLPVGFTKGGFPYRGDPDAPVVMVEYSDFQCPFCVRYFVQTEPALDDNYVRDGKVRVVFRDFPIQELHPNAPAAHLAALCVADQGAAKYWAMHDKVFQTQSEWSNSTDPAPVFERLAQEAGADVTLYKECMASGSKQALLDAAIAEGRAAGVSGTPSFQFFGQNGDSYLMVGAQPFEQFALYADALAKGEKPPVPAEEPQQQQGEAEIPFWATAEGWKPDPDRPGFNMAGDQYRGNLDAKVTVVEFSDFQCPYCSQHVTQTQPVLDKEFVDTGEVLWVYKHFPLDIHPQAPAAGAASECAADQGKFWEMHTALFADQGKWSVADPKPVFLDLAKELGLDSAAFETCLTGEDAANRVASDLGDGAAFVQGTPTFIVLFNGEGRIIPGALPPDRFSTVLREFVDQAK